MEYLWKGISELSKLLWKGISELVKVYFMFQDLDIN